MTTTARGQAPKAVALREIQAPVRDRLDEVAAELQRIVSADLPMLAEVNGHLMQMRGKMFRPTLCLLASGVEGRPEARAVPLAACVELIHLATLVHDDAVDHSVLRRGMPTINALFSHQVSVIMGDYLYARALAELVRLGDLEPMRILAHASTVMTIGEMHQLAALDALAFSEADYTALIRAKTAALLSGACEVGALAGAPGRRPALARYGERLGMAFQIADDLLDYTEDAATTGKPTGLDLKEHKVTLPLIASLPEMDAAARARVEALFAVPEPEADRVSEVIALVGAHGGIEYARRRGEEYMQEAEDSLAGLPDTPARGALADAITYVMERRW
ncbi:MAG TPA: polyprenyl synthetase family protein [Gemmatimonadaceae bacterium]|nr:polyprenyl synthetase family protein [Gemmatimonadaceae bacterium]